MIIAIDGPAASGKGTLARRLASHFGFAHLETGLLYRAVALGMIRVEGAENDSQTAESIAKNLLPTDLQDPEIRSEETGEVASHFATMPNVRSALRKFQRNFATNPPNGAKGAVVDGRDIGSVILPEADYKLFVTASENERARRRWAELQNRSDPPNFDLILSQLKERDRRDTERKVSPLTPAPDSYLLDTTDLDIDAAFAAAKAYISGPA